MKHRNKGNARSRKGSGRSRKGRIHTGALIVRKEVGPLVAAGFVTPARRCSVRVVGQFAVGDALWAGPRAVAVAVIRSLQAGAGQRQVV